VGPRFLRCVAADHLDPDTGEPGIWLEFRTEDGELVATEHRTATMFTWWDGLPEGIGWGGRGTIVLRARYRAGQAGPHVIGAGGVGRLQITSGTCWSTPRGC
jgi:hypothetical protein